MHYVKLAAICVGALVLYGIVMHYVAKFCGFNQTGHDE